MTKRRVTQADVARRAGVSQAAVSQILRGDPADATAFRAATRRKVLQAAEDLGYAPSILARALRTNQTMTIGVVLGWLTDELSLRVARGIQGVAHEREYDILIGDTEQMPEQQARLIERFEQHQVDGLVFIDSWSDVARLRAEVVDPPSIFVNLRQSIAERNSVVADHVRGGYEATRHLLDLGYRPVAHISGPVDWPAAAERRQGYRQALEDYNIAYEPELDEPGAWTMESGVAATLALLNRRPEIRAIFVANDHMAAGSIHAARQRGRRVPEDLALVGYDDRHFARLLVPALTSLVLPLEAMGQKAAHLLIDGLLAGETASVPSIAVPGGLAIRESCGARPSRETLVSPGDPLIAAPDGSGEAPAS